MGPDSGEEEPAGGTPDIHAGTERNGVLHGTAGAVSQGTVGVQAEHFHGYFFSSVIGMPMFIRAVVLPKFFSKEDF